MPPSPATSPVEGALAADVDPSRYAERRRASQLLTARSPDGRFPAEDAAAAKAMRVPALLGDERRQRWAVGVALQHAAPAGRGGGWRRGARHGPAGRRPAPSSAPRSSGRRRRPAPGRAAGPCRPWAREKRAGSAKRQGAPWMTSATSASERTVRAPTPGTSSRSAKSTGRPIRRGRQRAVQPPQHDVAGSDLVMRRHDQMRQQRLVLRRRWRFQRRDLAQDAVGAEIAQQVELTTARGLGPAVGEVDDLARRCALRSRHAARRRSSPTRSESQW